MDVTYFTLQVYLQLLPKKFQTRQRFKISFSLRPDSRGGGTSVGKVLGGLLLLLLVVVAGAWVRHLRRRRTVVAGARKKHEVKVPSDETNPDVVPTAVGEFSVLCVLKGMMTAVHDE